MQSVCPKALCCCKLFSIPLGTEAHTPAVNGHQLLFTLNLSFRRGLAQLCPFPRMVNLISLSGPHQGETEVLKKKLKIEDNGLRPRCVGSALSGGVFFNRLLISRRESVPEMRAEAGRPPMRACEAIDQLKSVQAVSVHAVRRIITVLPVVCSLIQKVIAPLAYWKDETDERRYKQGSTFLAILNNEKYYNANYVKNLQSLRRLVLVKYRDDVSLIPNESSWFGFEDKDGNLQRMEETSVFKENKLGLGQMLDDGRLIRLQSPREHLQLDENFFRENIIPILREQRKYS